MALIGKIREKSWLLVTLVGIALLAFILSDYKSIMGVGSDEYGIGTVYGKKVDDKKYELAVQRAEQIGRMQAQQQQREYTPQDQEGASDQGWASLVQDELLAREFDELGIDVSENEFKAYLYGTDGFTPLPEIAQQFTDSATGVFKKKELEARVKDMSTSKNAEIKKQWEEFKSGNISNRKKQKYFELLNQGVYVTSLEAEDEYYAQKETKSVSVVFKKYSDMNDADFKVSDSELNDYYEKHKNDKKYEIKESSREIKMMDVVVKPSKQDSSDIRKKIEVFKTGLQNSKNDSIYIYKNSDQKLYSSLKIYTAVPEIHSKAQSNRFLVYPQYLDTTFKTSQIGDVVGPYFSNGNIIVSKVQGFTPSKLKARHILLNIDAKADSTTLNKKKMFADSLLKLVNKDNFEEFAKKHSVDPGSKDKGGVIDDFLEAEMVKEFGEFCANQPIGTIGLVKSQYGYHIIEVLERDDSKLPVLASVTKTLKASQETIDTKENEAYTLLENFESKLNAVSDLYQRSVLFDTLVSQKKYRPQNPVNIIDNSPTLRGQVSPFVQDKILKFAYDSEAKAGTLLSAPIKDKEKYTIVYLSSIKKKGIPNLEDVKGEMRNEIIKEKKFARISNQLSVDKTLEDMARRAGVEIIKADVTFKNPQITNVGMEPDVIGAIFSGVKDGQRTKPIKGREGIFVVRIDSTKKAPATTTFKVEKDQLLATLKGGVNKKAIDALTKKADVIDNRNFYRLGIIRE